MKNDTEERRLHIMAKKNNVTSFINDHFFEQEFRARWSKDGFNRLRTYLGQVAKGNPSIYTAPFAKGDSMGQILTDWKEILVSISDKYPSLWEFENDLSNKVGPMSVQKPLMERMEDIAHYYWDILLPREPIDPRALDAVSQEFRKMRGLRVRGYRNTVDKMKKSTNSGNPFFTKRRNVIQESIPLDVCAYSGRHPDVYMQLPDGKWQCSAVVGWRGQEGGPSPEDTKQRVVWMFPFSVNIAELSVYQPLIESAQKLNLVPAWVSMESVDRNITKLFDTKGKDDLVVCTDFSKFDQHFNDVMQQGARTILASILNNDAKSTSWLKDVFPCKYLIPLAWEAVDTRVTYFGGEHGMASGSGGTNVDETLTHRALQYEAAILNNSQLNPYSMCLGDDGILTYPGITVDQVVKAYSAHGQECNVDKQYASTQDCVYLRRWHSTDYRRDSVCVGVYSTCRALGRLRYLERFQDPEYWSPEMVELRQLSIIENCKYHPLFQEFIEFCMKRDKYRLGIDIPGFLANIKDIAMEATTHMDDFLGYTKTLQGEGASGIADWEVVKYLKSKA
nr:MAG: RNA-dependent RNA polymerase [Porcine picobirnavirus]